MDSLKKILDRNGYRMPLDEAIEHAQEVAERLAERHYATGEGCELCAIEHWQIAEWLRELKIARKIIHSSVSSVHIYPEIKGIVKSDSGKITESRQAEQND